MAADEKNLALVTGAAQGIGRATTARLLQDGCRVIALDRNEDTLNDLQAELGDDTHIAVTEIHDYNPEEARLTVGVLVDYILRTQEPKESPRD